MNEPKKVYISIFTVIIVAILLIFAGSIAGFIFGTKNSANSPGIERNLDRERELLARIGEYERREQARISAERIRIAAENTRIERTEIAIRAIRESDRRSGSLLQELEQEVNILENFFWDYYDIFSNYHNNMAGERKSK